MMKRQRSWRRYTFMVFQFEKERMGEKMKKKLYLIVDEGIFEGNDLYDRRCGVRSLDSFTGIIWIRFSRRC